MIKRQFNFGNFNEIGMQSLLSFSSILYIYIIKRDFFILKMMDRRGIRMCMMHEKRLVFLFF